MVKVRIGLSITSTEGSLSKVTPMAMVSPRPSVLCVASGEEMNADQLATMVGTSSSDNVTGRSALTDP